MIHQSARRGRQNIVVLGKYLRFVHINCPCFNEGRRKREEGRRKREEGRGKREEGSSTSG
ncbi:hypothetical protein NDI47_13270 [Microcoleus vaginatus GB1-A2]|uniref:hypothetical protein n=1 Tax=Microcoleus vaginatus TaxID=119532 RepID=UPI001687BDC7|nr:hypothetical protein [Microcoleus sp. FACHB-61]